MARINYTQFTTVLERHGYQVIIHKLQITCRSVVVVDVAAVGWVCWCGAVCEEVDSAAWFGLAYDRLGSCGAWFLLAVVVWCGGVAVWTAHSINRRRVGTTHAVEDR